MADAVRNLDDPRSERLEEYVARFGGPPPLLYMEHLSDWEFATRVADAIESDVEITDAEFDGEASEHTTVY
jgi:hypothetical protein